MTKGIFISYRRDDAAAYARLIFNKLVSAYSRQSVFMDVDSISLGADFAEVLDQRLRTCSVLVAIIGRNWENSTGQAGTARLNDPSDFVRIEIESALKLNLPIIPVLVDGAQMPRPDKLPESLRPFSRRNAIDIGHVHFDANSAILVEALSNILHQNPATSEERTPKLEDSAPSRRVDALSFDAPSLAVLPFKNLTGDKSQDYLSDGIVEEVTIALGRTNWLLVVARNSSFSYKDRRVDLQTVGHELAVRYIVEGTTSIQNDKIRVTCQLSDVGRGYQIWSEKFDDILENVFDLQDRISTNIAAAIEPEVRRAEIQRSKEKPTENLDAYDNLLRGLAHFHLQTKDGIDAALVFFRKAMAIDPNFSSAYGYAAFALVGRRAQGWTTDPDTEASECINFARRAAELGARDPLALASAGFSLLYLRTDVAIAAALIEEALTMNRSLTLAWWASGLVQTARGDFDGAIRCLGTANRLSPRDPMLHMMRTSAGLASFLAKKFEDALFSADHSLGTHPNYMPALRLKIATLSQLGRVEEAKSEFVKLSQIDPELRVANLSSRLLPLRPADFELYADGLIRAGLQP